MELLSEKEKQNNLKKSKFYQFVPIYIFEMYLISLIVFVRLNMWCWLGYIDCQEGWHSVRIQIDCLTQVSGKWNFRGRFVWHYYNCIAALFIVSYTTGRNQLLKDSVWECVIPPQPDDILGLWHTIRLSVRRDMNQILLTIVITEHCGYTQ